MIECAESGLVYRNPKPHLKSSHAWHPSLVYLDDGSLLAGFDLGEAVESLDYRTYTARSHDQGRTWDAPRPLFEDPVWRRSTHSVRLGRTRDGTIVGFGGRFFRDDADEGLTNRANLGYVPMDLILLRSPDGGATWDSPATLDPPLIGPAFEICHRIIELDDGRWLAPTSTWRGWHGEAPNGMKAIALVSYDRGTTWPGWVTVIDQYEKGIISWEQGLTQLADGRLLGVVWSFEEKTGRSLPNHFALSADTRTFSEPRENGLHGETAKLLTLSDGRVLCMYRRTDRPGLWANLVRIDGDDWVNVAETPVWQGLASGMKGQGTAGDELSALKFGFPSMVELPSGEVLAVFWCLEECLHVIRWARLVIKG
ncbi:MAG: exo-alpha-sialidase [Planctomycetes bacterium]|nr:exo-alpha-sialidase [Planctomycetota bacterium]